MAEQQECIKSVHADLEFHKHGNKAGKLLSRLCKGQFKAPHITTLKDRQGHATSSPLDINKVLESFYTSLYVADTIDTSQAKHFLDSSKLPQISSEQLLTLNAPISQTEIEEAIKTLASNKSPGPDDLSDIFYKLT